MLVLGIETSCDETAAAVVSSDKRILSNVILSQTAEHLPFGGVVPEVAARSHLEHLDAVIAQAMQEANLTFDQLDGIAATAGPGLIGGVMVGLATGKSIAAACKLPFAAVNHLEGHALTARLTDEIAFPYLLLLVSGGHCLFLAVEGVGRYVRLGGTRDDAVGEAFDKVAKMLGLGLPGGPKVEVAAKAGNPQRYAFPRPLMDDGSCDLSLSGLKTAVLRAVQALPAPLADQDIANICASFQQAVVDVLRHKTQAALTRYIERWKNGTLVVAGGVAANKSVRLMLESLAQEHSVRFAVAPAALCTDNAAMIAWAGIERLKLGMKDSLDAAPRARWPLEA